MKMAKRRMVLSNQDFEAVIDLQEVQDISSHLPTRLEIPT
jgi:hypothetical protein